MNACFPLLFALCFSCTVLCQNTGIGTTAPKNKLHVAGGLRIDTLANNVDSGILRHDKNGIVYSLKFTGNANDVLKGNGSFGPAGGGSSGWLITGNTGTNPAVNFIGTADDQPLVFRANNTQVGKISSNNIGWGLSSLGSTSGNGNIAIGIRALASNASGNSNVAIGTDALRSNVIKSNLVAIGDSALYNNVGNAGSQGSRNTAIGSRALYSNITGQTNTAVGFRSLYSNDGTDNTASGVFALFNNSTGSTNTAIGASALFTNTTGSSNTAIGVNADVLSNNLSYATAIGYGAQVGSSNSLVLGGTGFAAVNVGIGVTNPLVTFHVKGTANFYNGDNTHTGDFYAGTSSVDGIELASTGTDAYAGIQRTSNYALHLSKKNVSSNNGLAGFLVNGVLVGSITTNGATTAFNTTSDIRLKENIGITHYGLNTLLKINVSDYNYRSDKKKTIQTGFLAQELYDLYPQAVQVGGENEATNPWMVDYSKLTPLLVKSIQDQQQVIVSQQQELQQLKEKIDHLTALYNAIVKK